MIGRYPNRIVCLTDETTETLYLLGEQHRIVGISGFTRRPPQARKEKPRVCAFTSAKTEKILALEPDLVLGFSDLQADVAARLIRAGIQVHVFNQRTVAGIFDMIALLGAMIGEAAKAAALGAQLRVGVERVERAAAHLSRRPRVYFEEWDEPLISGIGWVSELIRIAGGEDCFPELATEPSAARRVVDTTEVVRRAPDIVVGSWCGRRFRPARVRERARWDTIPAVRDGHLYEIRSCDILQPGPAALTDGLHRLHDIVVRWVQA